MSRRRALVVAAAAAIVTVLVVVIAGSTPAPAPPTPAPATSAAPSPTTTPEVATPVASSGTGRPSIIDRRRVYFARAGLPPISVHVDGIASEATPEERVRSRLQALDPARAVAPPAGAVNALAADVTGARTPSAQPNEVRVGGVTIAGDLATVDFALPAGGWRTSTKEQEIALLQQLVYTATEEPGVSRALFTANGAALSIGSLAATQPRAREDVFGYAARGETATVTQHGDAKGPLPLRVTWAVDEIGPGLARVTIDTGIRGGPAPGAIPAFTAEARRNDESAEPDLAKWAVIVHVPNARRAAVPSGAGQGGSQTFTTPVDKSPLRTVREHDAYASPTLDIQLGLDDLRPWRTALAFDPVRIIVDVGGPPGSIAGPNAVYAPAPNARVDRTVKVVGVASAFEANMRLRLRDSGGNVVVSGFTTASQCCEPGGVFEATLQAPASVAGPATVEVFEESQRDTTELNLIRIPICVACPPPTPRPT